MSFDDPTPDEALDGAIKMLDDCRKLFEADGGDDIWQMHLRKAIRDLTALKAKLSASAT